VRAECAGKTAWGWGIAANQGAPTFDTQPVLAGRVSYPQGAGVVTRVHWRGPVTVAWGAKAPVLDVEMAYLVANTLQSATGLPVRYMSTADLPDSLRRSGTLILVGSPHANPLVPASAVPAVAAGGDTAAANVGVVKVVAAPSRTTLLLTGRTPRAVEAAATDFVLRYWRHAKDSAIRITGMEPGAALGHRAGVTNANPP
jgi:hypothetical protein